MGCGSVLLVRRSVADMAVQDNECRAALRLSKNSPSAARCARYHSRRRLADTFHPYARNRDATSSVNVEARATLDRDVIVVVDPAEIVEAQMARQRCGFGADALHQTAIATNRVDVVVEDLKARPVVAAAPATSPRSPCPRSWQFPVPTDRWSSRRPIPSDTPDDPELCCPAGENGGYRRA